MPKTLVERPLPSNLAALYLRVVKGSLPALEAVLAHPKYAWDKYLRSVYRITDAICECPTPQQRAPLWARLSEAYPSGHPVWQQALPAAMKTDVATVRWLQTQGASFDITYGTGDQKKGPQWLALFILHHAHHAPADVAEFFDYVRLQPAGASKEAVSTAWFYAIQTPSLPWMLRFYELGCDPLAPFHSEGGIGMTPAQALIEEWKKTSGKEPAIKEALMQLDAWGVDWNAFPAGGRRYANEQTPLERMASERSYSDGQPLLPKFLKWRSERLAQVLQTEMAPSQPPLRRPRM